VGIYCLKLTLSVKSAVTLTTVSWLVGMQCVAKASFNVHIAPPAPLVAVIGQIPSDPPILTDTLVPPPLFSSHLQQFTPPEDGCSMSEVTKLTACCKSPKGDHQLNKAFMKIPKVMSCLILEGDTNGSCTCNSNSKILLTCLPCIYDFDVGNVLLLVPKISLCINICCNSVTFTCGCVLSIFLLTLYC